MLASGYWISTCWLSNAKKYFDSLVLPDLERQVAKTPKKRQSKIRHRRGSDALPPWPDINTDLLCAHNNLSLLSVRHPVNVRFVMQRKKKHKLVPLGKKKLNYRFVEMTSFRPIWKLYRLESAASQ